ncbi:hypothetical protein CspHIS471_0605600 [Cutaneotrichosporon sp. HIS471]|nr:hypothetical protein CspHIS471_0605600 [Cutaneotrichosporon sp. HIS471]
MYGFSSQPVPDQPKFVSAIPNYLARPRTVPSRCPVGHVAPIVNNAATFSPSLSESVLFIVGAQAHAGGLAYDVLDGPRSFFAGAVEPASSSSPLPLGSSESEVVTPVDGPVTLDVATSTDGAGRETRAILAYFRSRAAMAAWRAAGFEKWWTDPARERDGAEGYGWFLEVLIPSADRRETIISNPEGQREGVAVLAEGTCGPILEGGYRGASRDRIAASQNDSLLGEGEGGPETVDPHKDKVNDSPSLVRTGRVQVRGQKNLCVIRSGQDWRGGDDEERASYPSIQHSLIHAMDDLREHARELGCHGIRFMTVLDNDVEPTDRTFGLAYFASMTQLEDWAATRPAHLDVVHRFVKYATERRGNISVRLWHEIFVLEPSMQEFEYINCAPGGGVLGVS